METARKLTADERKALRRQRIEAKKNKESSIWHLWWYANNIFLFLCVVSKGQAKQQNEQTISKSKQQIIASRGKIDESKVALRMTLQAIINVL